jgi:SynChlorMet cassette protein ScmD
MTNPVVVLREELDDFAMLFNPDSGEAVGLNPTGVAVWKRLDGQHTPQQIAAEIDQLFEGAPQSVQAEVDSFIQELLANGFAGKTAGPGAG